MLLHSYFELPVKQATTEGLSHKYLQGELFEMVSIVILETIRDKETVTWVCGRGSLMA